MENNLFINRLCVYPYLEKKLDVTFRKGLNIIRADLFQESGNADNNQGQGSRNSVGKTTFVNLIDYGLGKEEFIPKDKKKTRLILKDRFLLMEFEIGEHKLTLQRKLVDGESCTLHEGWVIESLINRGELPTVPMGINEYRSWIEGLLFNGENYFNDERLISLRQIISIIFREQLGGFDSIDKPGGYDEGAEIKRLRLNLLTGLNTKEKLQKNSEKKIAEVKVKEAKKSLDIIKRYVTQKVELSEVDIFKELNEIDRVFISKTQIIEHLKEQLVSLQEQKDIWQSGKEELLSGISKVNKEIELKKSRIIDYRATFNEIMHETYTLDIAEQAKESFAEINYKMCPVCLVDIECGKSFSCPKSTKERDEDVLSLIKTVINNEKEDLKQAENVLLDSIQQLEVRKMELSAELDEVNKLLKYHFVELLNELSEQESLQKELEQKKIKYENLLESLKDIDVYEDNWEQEKQILKEIKKEITKLNKKVKEVIANFAILYDEVVKYLYRGLRKGELKVSPRAGNFSANIKYDGEYDSIDTGAAALTLKVIAFDLALLKLSVYKEIPYPNFLVHDSPNVREIAPETYNRIFTFITNIEKDLVKSGCPINFQYIITTIQIPDEFKPDSEYIRLTMDNRGDGGKLFGFTFY